MIKDKAFYKTILRLSLPAAFQSLINLLVVMADNLMVTRVDPGGMAFTAVLQSNSITSLVLATLTGLASGSIVLISQYWGKKDILSIRDVSAAVLVLCMLVAFTAIFLILLFPKQILLLVINRNDTAALDYAMAYLPLVSLSYLPYAVTACLIGMLKGVEIVRVTVYATLLSFLANVALNYLLIFGKLGLPVMGVSGAALATVLARVLELSLVLFYCTRVQKTLKVRMSMIYRQAAWAWHDFIKFGLPVGLTDMLWAFVGIIKMVIIGQMGSLMSNAAGIADSLMNLGTLFTFALAGGAAVMVGKAVGSGNIRLVRAYSSTIQIMFLFIGVVMAGLVYLLRVPFISLYSLPASAARLAERMISLCTLTLIGTSYHASCFVGINRGAGDNRFVMVVDLICGWLIMLPLTALSAFVFRMPMDIVYFFTRIDQTFKWLIAFIRLRGEKWIHNVTRQERDGVLGTGTA
jgi:putative MATE family efflux protein